MQNKIDEFLRSLYSKIVANMNKIHYVNIRDKINLTARAFPL